LLRRSAKYAAAAVELLCRLALLPHPALRSDRRELRRVAMGVGRVAPLNANAR
jgi:hypothetical protein